MDLTSWAREKALWNRKNWGEYTNQLSELYVALYQFENFWKWTKTELHGKRIAFLDDHLKNSARMLLIGGEDSPNAIGRFMYSLFGVRALGANDYDDTLTLYKRRGDRVAFVVGDLVLGTSHDNFEQILNQLKDLILSLGGQVPEIPKEEFLSWVSPDEPKLVEKFNHLLRTGCALLPMFNPYSAISYYLDTAPLLHIEEILNGDIHSLRELSSLWRIGYIYNSKLEKVDLEKASEEDVDDFFWLSHFNPSPPSIPALINALFGEFGDVSAILSRLSRDVRSAFKEWWKDKYNFVTRTYNLEGWDISEDTRGILRYIQNGDEYSLVPTSGTSFVLVDNAGYKTYTATIPLSRFIEEIFPLISAGYIRTPNWVGNESGTPLEKRYLKIKVNRTESRYGKQFYYDGGSWVIKGLL
ncbi:hypothetical protein TK0438 [Thermococcus kodakarensis KOD1]|uniref:Uncharacterized protein n=2 Tax=Thermococcus TaxID=2263 RepID=Q5JD51_THEKO|nr:hypothetical protein TK0438 [Thermococcus kodakarensis KOD1]